MLLSSIEFFARLALLILFGYFYFIWTFNFWKNRNVRGPTPTLVFGNFWDVIINRISLGDQLTKFYNQFPNEPFVGIFDKRTPMLVMKDPDLIKDVLIKDFSVFADRGIPTFEKVEPLSSLQLVTLEPERWRPMRNNLSPVFTSGKLKDMFYLLQECAKNFGEFLDKCTATNEEIECRELTAKFTTDVIGVCAFGLKMNALDDENSMFRKMGRQIFIVDRWKAVKFIIRQAAPWLYKLLGFLMYDRELNEFFINTMNQTVSHRKEHNLRRNDFVDTLIEIKDNPKKLGHIECTDALLTAQAFVFFVAGFETSSATISHTLYEMALNPAIQNELRKEIMEKYREVDGKLKYEDIKEMKYLQKVFCETLRKYPSVTLLMRKSLRKYTFTNTNVTIPEGQQIFIPIYAIHRDPKNYPDPDIFDPERFSEENIKLRHPSTYLPFGDGPRNCIGARFANHQTKIGIITILKNYEVQRCGSTCIPYINDPKRRFTLAPKGEIILRFKKLEHVSV